MLIFDNPNGPKKQMLLSFSDLLNVYLKQTNMHLPFKMKH